MPKIGFLVNSLEGGGAEKIVLTLCSELGKKSDVELICLEKKIFYQFPNYIKITYLIDSKKQNYGNLKKMFILPFLAWKLKKFIEMNNIELVQSHLNRANYVNILAKLFNSKHKSQIVIHGIISRYQKRGLLGIINLLLIKALYPRANLVITISKAMKNDLIQFLKSPKNIIVINNLYDIKSIYNDSKKCVDDFYFKKDTHYLVSVGRLIKLKRNRDLLYALQYLPTNVELILIGEGDERKNLEIIAKKLNLFQRVHFLGRKQNPFQYMTHCDIFINCSENEGFPNVLIEAMTCGLPIISSDCLSGPREILAPNTNINFQLKDGIEEAEFGILYPVGDIESLVKAISIMLNNKKLRNFYIEKGKRRAFDFSVEKIIKEYKKVLLNE